MAPHIQSSGAPEIQWKYNSSSSSFCIICNTTQQCCITDTTLFCLLCAQSLIVCGLFGFHKQVDWLQRVSVVDRSVCVCNYMLEQSLSVWCVACNECDGSEWRRPIQRPVNHRWRPSSWQHWLHWTRQLRFRTRRTVYAFFVFVSNLLLIYYLCALPAVYSSVCLLATSHKIYWSDLYENCKTDVSVVCLPARHQWHSFTDQVCCVAQLAERRSLAGELTLFYPRPVADGWPLSG